MNGWKAVVNKGSIDGRMDVQIERRPDGWTREGSDGVAWFVDGADTL